ncbi:hypothetical protein COCNU_scaffold016389G000020 [Cocos nucifera]|nr:hypothetical protein [Cocos nucifera]
MGPGCTSRGHDARDLRSEDPNLASLCMGGRAMDEAARCTHGIDCGQGSHDGAEGHSMSVTCPRWGQVGVAAVHPTTPIGHPGKSHPGGSKGSSGIANGRGPGCASRPPDSRDSNPGWPHHTKGVERLRPLQAAMGPWGASRGPGTRYLHSGGANLGWPCTRTWVGVQRARQTRPRNGANSGQGSTAHGLCDVVKGDRTSAVSPRLGLGRAPQRPPYHPDVASRQVPPWGFQRTVWHCKWAGVGMRISGGWRSGLAQRGPESWAALSLRTLEGDAAAADRRTHGSKVGRVEWRRAGAMGRSGVARP